MPFSAVAPGPRRDLSTWQGLAGLRFIMNDASHSESSAVSSISAAPGTGAAVYVPEHTEQIVSHIEKHAGVPARVLHAVDSADQAAVDIHVVEPSEARPFRTFVTAGMSDFAMVPPKMYSDWKYAELFLCLPTSWRIDYDNWQKDENAWPLRILANIARLPPPPCDVDLVRADAAQRQSAHTARAVGWFHIAGVADAGAAAGGFSGVADRREDRRRQKDSPLFLAGSDLR